MPKSKATAETLSQFSSTLKNNRDDILYVKNSMDNELNSFLWEDPIGNAFRAKYYEDLKPIESKLVPNLEAYSRHLDQEAAIVNEYGSN
jgi:hypothetical protein